MTPAPAALSANTIKGASFQSDQSDSNTENLQDPPSGEQNNIELSPSNSFQKFSVGPENSVEDPLSLQMDNDEESETEEVLDEDAPPGEVDALGIAQANRTEVEATAEISALVVYCEAIPTKRFPGFEVCASMGLSFAYQLKLKLYPGLS